MPCWLTIGVYMELVNLNLQLVNNKSFFFEPKTVKIFENKTSINNNNFIKLLKIMYSRVKILNE